ncbi:MAG: hypothetical protein J6N49_05570 [Alphaproteobacteria bacterium]|nr:hypothetical protein [Alphaproteobacteria bacterium]
MKKFFLLTSTAAILAFLNSYALAADINNTAVSGTENTEAQNTDKSLDLDNVMNAYVPAPSQIASIQLSTNKRIQYMIDNYTTPQLAQHAIQLNQAEIQAAKLSGQEPPAKLTRAILEDREKIADYLRDHYKFKY